MSPLIPLLPHKLITDIQIPIKVQPGGFVMEVGAGLAFVKQLQRLLGRNVQAFGQLHGDGTNAVAHDNLLYHRGFNRVFYLPHFFASQLFIHSTNPSASFSRLSV